MTTDDLTEVGADLLAHRVQQVAGMWLPSSDQHMAGWLRRSTRVGGRGTYQLHKIHRALSLLPADARFGVIDVGAHIGTWSWVLAQRGFRRIWAIEPVPLHFACLLRNLTPKALQGCFVEFREVAVGDQEDVVSWSTTQTNTGETWLTRPRRADQTVRCTTVDRLVYDDSTSLTRVDLVKIDCEGYEERVVRGAEATLRRWRPAVVVEQDPRYPSRHGLQPGGALAVLQGWGYQIQHQMVHDYFLTHPEGRHA